MRSLIAVALIIALAACAGGSTPLPGAPATSPIVASRHKHGSLKISIRVPKKQRHRRIKIVRNGKPAYISPATQSMSIAVSGPTSLNEAVGLTPTSTGCSSSLTGTFCSLTISGLAPGNYTASISTYDGPVSVSGTATGNVLSQAQDVGFTIFSGQSNAISMTLGGIPAAVALVPGANSTLSGSMSSGYTLSKCGSDAVSVIGVDADDNYILGAGAPTPSLRSDSATLTVATPAPASPNAFTITRPTANLPAGGSTVHLTASVTPTTDSGGSSVTSSIAMTFDNQICGVITEYSIPTARSYPEGIAAGPDGAVWFVENATSKVGRVTSAGAITETALPSNSTPFQLTAGADGALWVTDPNSNALYRVSVAGAVTTYPTAVCCPYGIAAGPDGALWVTMTVYVSKITTGGTETDYALASGAIPQMIAAGSDGALWFPEQGTNKIARITTAGAISETSLPGGNSNPFFITSGPDGALWFSNSPALATITTSETITEYPSITASFNSPVTSGPDGAVWLMNNYYHLIERVATNGVVTKQYTAPATPSHTYVNGITTGPDGSLWFTDCGNNAIGRLQ